MTKWILLPFLIIVVQIAVAQTSGSDSSSLKNVSLNLLDRRIDFFQLSGRLEAALSKLSSEQNIKFSYSDDKIQNVNVTEKNYSSEPLSRVLTSLLANSGFTYLVVGRMIVIIESKEVRQEEAASSDTTQKPSGSAGTVSSSELSINHVYNSNAQLARLSPAQRREIERLYKKEMAWSLRSKRILRRFGKDTIPKEAKRPRTVYNYAVPEKGLYASGSFGVISFNPRFRENSSLRWREDLNFNSYVQNCFPIQLSAGVKDKYYMAGAGVSYHRYSMEGSGRFIHGKGHLGKADTSIVSISNKYSVFSIPLEFMFYKNIKKFFAGGGPKATFDFIDATTTSGAFQKYFDKAKGENFVEKNNKLAASLSLKIFAGVSLKDQYAVTAGGGYTYYVSPHSKNDLYSFYPNHWRFELSFLCFISGAKIRSVFYKR